MDPLVQQILVALAMGLIGAAVFAGVGLISGTDETTTIAPLTLLVALLGVPPAGVFTFFSRIVNLDVLAVFLLPEPRNKDGDELAYPVLGVSPLLMKKVPDAVSSGL